MEKVFSLVLGVYRDPKALERRMSDEKQIAAFAYVVIINATLRHNNLVQKGCFSKCPRFGA